MSKPPLETLPVNPQHKVMAGNLKTRGPEVIDGTVVEKMVVRGAPEHERSGRA